MTNEYTNKHSLIKMHYFIKLLRYRNPGVSDQMNLKQIEPALGRSS